MKGAAAIPDFDANGNLPPGIYPSTWSEFCERFANTEHRKKLLDGLAAALSSLADAGVA
jgi:hypothetical protein